MISITGLSPSVLRKAADIQEKILSLQIELNRLFEDTARAQATPTAATPKPTKRRKTKREISAEGLANIRAGAAKRKAARLAKLGATITKQESKSKTA